MSKVDRSNTRATFVSVHECRVCGCIIPDTQGVDRHKKVCRLMFKTSNPYVQQMTTINFPCPIILAESITPLSKKPARRKRRRKNDLPDKDVSTLERLPRRKSSLKALEFFRQVNDKIARDDGGGTLGKDDLSEESEPEFSAESDSSYSKKPVNRKKKIGLNRRIKRTQSKNPVERKEKIGLSGRKKRTQSTYMKNRRLKKGFQFVCPIEECGAVLSRLNKLKEHFIIHLENNPYKCTVPGCNMKLCSPWALDRHIKLHREKTHVRRNGVGDEDISIKTEAEATKDEIAPKKRQKFNVVDLIMSDPVFHRVCEKTPDFKDLILRVNFGRKRTDSSEKVYKCGKCFQSYCNLKTLQMHDTMNHRARNFVCKLCGVSFLREGALNKHMKFHKSMGNEIYMKKLGNKKWKCTKCGFVSNCANELSIRRHWSTLHNTTIPKSSTLRASTRGRGGSFKRNTVITVEKIRVDPTFVKTEAIGFEENSVVKIEPDNDYFEEASPYYCIVKTDDVACDENVKLEVGESI